MSRRWLPVLLVLCAVAARADSTPLPDLASGASHDIHEVLKGPDFNVRTTHTELHDKHEQQQEQDKDAGGGAAQDNGGPDEPAPAHPAEKPLPRLSKGAQQDIHQVLQGPAFNERESHTEMRSKHPLQAPPHMATPGWLSQLLGGLGGVLLWALLALVLVAVLWHWRRWADLLVSLKPDQVVEAPALLRRQPMAAAEGPLPEDIAAAAEAAWARGDSRAALSLLYRGALTVLQQRGHIQLPDSATEQESLRQVRASQPRETTEGFGLIVRAWLIEAYGGAHPADFAQVLKAYRQYFSGSPA